MSVESSPKGRAAAAQVGDGDVAGALGALAGQEPVPPGHDGQPAGERGGLDHARSSQRAA